MEEFWTGGGPNDVRQIENYALIGDCETAALVSRNGSIDWLCWPRFDSEAAFAALLGDGGNGFWRIAPTAEIRQCRRRYRGHTLILETELETAEGTIVLTDFMPIRGKSSDIVRIVEGRSGRVTLRSVLSVRFGYGRLAPLLRKVQAHEVSAIAGPHGLVLRTDHQLDAHGGAITSEFEIGEGERAAFVLTYFPSHEDPPEPVDPDRSLRATDRFWSDWAGRCTYEGPYWDQVVRSMLTLKALTYRPTGGTVAAPTSSLPEDPGGCRNWDYRFCWLRDAAFMLLSFVHAGYTEEAEAWRDWLIRALAGEPCEIHPLYRVDGGRDLHEIEADWLTGFNGSRPVRFGNAAHEQMQVDVFGEVLDALHLGRRHQLDTTEASWRLQQAMLQSLERRWREADAGFWEVRSDPEHFVHSKALAWAAFDRAIRGFDGQADEQCRRRWSAIREEIHREVLAKGVDRSRDCFVRSYGSDQLDASTLMLPLVGFIEPKHPLAIGTIAAIERALMPEGLVLRYDPTKADDGLPGSEGAFLACSFWLADNYHLQGRREEAEQLFEKLLGLANDVGLLSEEYSTAEGRQLGNFPQALTHVALVNTASNLSEAKGPVEERLSIHA